MLLSVNINEGAMNKVVKDLTKDDFTIRVESSWTTDYKDKVVKTRPETKVGEYRDLF
jgi:hypothetical protein